MEFIVLIIALILRQLPGAVPTQRQDRWFYRWADAVRRRFRPKKPHLYEEAIPVKPSKLWLPARWLNADGPLFFILSGPLFFAVIVPVAAFSLLLSVLETLLWGLPAFAVSLLVLLYSLGRKDSAFWMTRFQIAWRQQDLQGAYHYAAAILPDWRPSVAARQGSDAASQQLANRVFDRLLLIRFRDLFLVLFWFMLLGAEGALLVRLTLLLLADRQMTPEKQIAQDKTDAFCSLLEWLPVRLLGGSFMLTGHFANTSALWLHSFFNGSWNHEHLLARYARGALGESVTTTPDAVPEAPEALADSDAEGTRLEVLEQLLTRSAVLWVIVLSLLVALVQI